MVMEEFDQNSTAKKLESDEFYEKIEAPKFVDFTVPDHYRPDDDRYWFCLRVGCDQKHEEEIDPEAIYKDFVLRVMAARSPNIKIRKMLNRKPSSTLKCPLTAPAKPSKSRISRLAVISSISRKLDVGIDKAKPLSKLTATPKAGSKQPSPAAKAFTTPRSKKQVSNSANFRSVQNPKPMASITAQKSKVVNKALVFRSPKKTVRIKTSLEMKTPVGKLCADMSKLKIASGKKKQPVELKTPVGKLCAAMWKLEIASGKEQTVECNKKPLPLEKTARKQFRGREVKSRVYDSLRSHTHMGKETKPLKNMKRKKMRKDSEHPCDTAKDNDSSDMEIDERSRHGSLEGCPVSVSLKNDKTNCHEEDIVGLKDKASDLSEPEEIVKLNEETESPTVMDNDDKENALACDDDKANKIKPSDGTNSVGLKDKASDSSELEEIVKLNEKIKSPTVLDNDDKENTLSSDDVKVNKIKPSDGTNSPKNFDNDNKENALASDDKENNDEAIECEDKENASASDHNREQNVQYEAKVLTNCDTEKVSQVTKKLLKKSSIVTPGPQEAKYRKPKPTNPKPFRLRTDERGILKEATLEKKLVTPLKEITTSIKPSRSKSLRKNQKNENCQGQSENENVTREDGKQSMDKAGMDQPRTKITGLRINTTSAKKGPLLTKEHARVVGAATRLEKISERMKSSAKTPKGFGPNGRKAAVLGVMKEAAKPSENEASSNGPRSVLRGKKPTTIPKEPNFHTIHVPKSCTRKLEA